MKPVACTLAWMMCLVGLANWVAGQEASSIEYFEKYIRPVLVEKCLECHAVDKEVSGGLTLDSKTGWQSGGDSGSAIEPGAPDKSRLIEAMEYGNADLQMPPQGKLPAEVIQRFKDWIAAGAVDPRETAMVAARQSTALPVERATEHWAYRPIVRPDVPVVSREVASSSATAVDSFLMRKQAEVAIECSGPADDAVQVRRLYFDLHGLPPTAEQLESFLADTSPNRYEQLVDQLLASPRFGERMARHWMDVARYAESITLRGFVLPQAWRYRDYLIDAFNADRSFADMIQEQIAGDLLEHPDFQRRAEQMVATSFLALGNTNLEEQDKTQLEMDYIDEQLEVIGKAFLGQTIGCARCHDHKFDPIPTQDYYALAGIFRATRAMDHENVSKWIERPIPLPPDQQAAFDQLASELDSLKQLQGELEKSASADTKPTKASVVPIGSLPGVVIDDSQAQKVGAWKESNFEKPHVGQGYVHDSHEAGAAKTITFEPKMLTPGGYTLRLAYTAAANRSSKTVVRVFSADGEKQLSINQQQKPPIDGLWINLGDFRFEKDGQAFVLISNEEADGHVIADAVQFIPVAASNAAGNSTADGSASDKTKARSPDKTQAELKQLKERRAKLETQLAARPMAISIVEQTPAHDLPIHIRGNIHNLGSPVPRGFLQLASIGPSVPLPTETSGRKELAQWLTDSRHPLTSRVMANRVWAWIMGEGLVRTVDNFGTTGEQPHDQELLDFLACSLTQQQWSLKQLVRQLVLSDAYRRSATPTERAREIDPENRYYSHANLKRIEVESLRDAMLAISGELQIPSSGSTLRPAVKEDYRYVHQPNLRAVYLPVLRNSLPELFEVFDFPSTSVSTGHRSRSSVAPQALSLLNSPWVLQRAMHASQRLMNDLQLSDSMTPQAWGVAIDEIFMRCIGRTPTPIERYTSSTLVEELQQQNVSSAEITTRLIHGLFASVDFRYLD